METNLSPLQTNFYLTKNQIQFCDKHYLLYWEKEYFIFRFAQFGASKIVREDIEFEVQFTDNLTIKELLESADTIVKLSFRREYGQKTGFVLVARQGQAAPQTPRLS